MSLGRSGLGTYGSDFSNPQPTMDTRVKLIFDFVDP
jgi:hypothetical protein